MSVNFFNLFSFNTQLTIATSKYNPGYSKYQRQTGLAARPFTLLIRCSFQTNARVEPCVDEIGAQVGKRKHEHCHQCDRLHQRQIAPVDGK